MKIPTFSLNFFRKIASHPAEHNYLSMLLTTFDHLREQKLITPSIDKTLAFDSLSHLSLLHEKGYSIIQNFLDAETCHHYKNEIDYIINEYPELLHKNIDDQRIHGAEILSSKINHFSKNLYLKKIATSFNYSETKTAFTLAAKLSYSPGNIGSGGGWHRDSCIKQFKAILYLSDVSEKNGPFQLISKSNNLVYKLLDDKKANQPYMGYRYTNEQVKKIISKNPDRLITFCASAGTLILVDTSCIHRGMPIIHGKRYTLFNYYYPINKINDDLFKKFSPIAR